MNHILEAKQFDREYLEKLFKKADEFENTRPALLTGKIMASLFYEPSTRTRLSFESAMHRLDGAVITTENAKEFSSAAKGETLEDTIRIIDDYADVIVIRHPDAGSAAKAAAVSSVPVINAGDGAAEHPTQALLDLYTIQKETGAIDGRTVALVGDLKYGRAARSLARVLALYNDVHLILASPPELALGSDIAEELKAKGVSLEVTHSLDEAIARADVVYMTRIQKERFPNQDEYQKLKGSYVLTRALADSMKEKAIIMHPLPRVDEIAPDVDLSSHARYFEEARNGVAIRMALLAELLG